MKPKVDRRNNGRGFVSFIFVLVGIASGFFVGYASPWHNNDIELSIDGTLHLFGKVGSFLIYSEEGFESFLVANGSMNLYLEESGNDGKTVTHFINGHIALETELSQEGVVKKQSLFRMDEEGRQVRVYIDKNGDSKWDRMIDYKNQRIYNWKDEKWVDPSLH